jgi:hypothetical protein
VSDEELHQDVIVFLAVEDDLPVVTRLVTVFETFTAKQGSPASAPYRAQQIP